MLTFFRILKYKREGERKGWEEEENKAERGNAKINN
jgi:hypothetical protein